MLFIFYITLSTFLNYLLEINGFSIMTTREALKESKINSSFNDTEMMTENQSVMAKHKSLLHIILNPSEAPNLNSNIFDKMLSNEMLSIKQQLFEKNETNVTPFYITFKNSIATPTLVLNQRWPIAANINKASTTTNNQNILSIPKIDENYNDEDRNDNNSIQSKVLGVRSFAALHVHKLESPNNYSSTKRQCTCMKTNPHTACSFRCSEHRTQTCTQTENYVAVDPQCTRNVMPFSYYPYHYIYSTLFLPVTTDASIIYYHPDVINELKLPKHHSHIKKPSVDNIYLVSDDTQYYEYLENANSNENRREKEDYLKSKYKIGKKKRPKKGKSVYVIDYKEEDSKPHADKISEGHMEVLDRDKFVEDVVQDLKVYYSDAVIKDCYCSLSSFKFRTGNLIIYIPILLTLIK